MPGIYRLFCKPSILNPKRVDPFVVEDHDEIEDESVRNDVTLWKCPKMIELLIPHCIHVVPIPLIRQDEVMVHQRIGHGDEPRNRDSERRR
jgi:hypothetical protein